MKIFRLSVLLSVLSAGVLSACHEKKENTNTHIQSEDLAEWNAEEYSLYSRKIREEIHSLRLMPSQMYADSYARRYYADNAPFLWITRSGVDERADTLLAYLRNHPATGLSETAFHISEIQDCLQRIRQLAFDDRNDINTVFGRAEFLLTQTYLRYACGQRFGYIRPSMLFNRLEKSDTTKNAPFVQLYDIETENADEEFVQRALSALQDDRLGDFLLDIQPQSPLYLKMEETYRQANDQTSLRKIAANIERSRWRTPQPEGKHVWVNLAAATLQATDEDGHTALDMRICIGSKQHKTPMLHSRIERADLNPYWNVPYSIIKKEIAPRHAGDVDYFERNHYRIFDKESGEEMPPADVTAAMLASGNYKVRQDNGDGNSLGRLIFRFRNNFSIFLHDTNNKQAFKRKNRAISHGCVRVEKPLELAIFLLPAPDERIVEKLETAIGLSRDGQPAPPDTEEGEPRIESGRQSFEPPVPLFIEYYTIYPRKTGGWDEFPDPYGYDELLVKKLEGI